MSIKLWVALPTDFNSPQQNEWSRFAYSNAAMCPPKTLEMEQDGLDWFEVEILRNMTKGKKGQRIQYWPWPHVA